MKKQPVKKAAKKAPVKAAKKPVKSTKKPTSKTAKSVDKRPIKGQKTKNKISNLEFVSKETREVAHPANPVVDNRKEAIKGNLQWKEEGNPKSDVEFIANPDGKFALYRPNKEGGTDTVIIDPKLEIAFGFDPYAVKEAAKKGELGQWKLRDIPASFYENLPDSMKPIPQEGSDYKGHLVIGSVHGTFSDEKDSDDEAKRFWEEFSNPTPLAEGFKNMRMFVPRGEERFDQFGTPEERMKKRMELDEAGMWAEPDHVNTLPSGKTLYEAFDSEESGSLNNDEYPKWQKSLSGDELKKRIEEINNGTLPEYLVISGMASKDGEIRCAVIKRTVMDGKTEEVQLDPEKDKEEFGLAILAVSEVHPSILGTFAIKTRRSVLDKDKYFSEYPLVPNPETFNPSISKEKNIPVEVRPREMADHELVKNANQDFALPEDKMLGKKEPIPDWDDICTTAAGTAPLPEPKNAIVDAQEALYASLGKKLMQVCSAKQIAPEAGLEIIKSANVGVPAAMRDQAKPQGDKTIQDIRRKKLFGGDEK